MPDPEKSSEFSRMRNSNTADIGVSVTTFEKVIVFTVPVHSSYLTLGRLFIY
jgi:hypothetical protein